MTPSEIKDELIGEFIDYYDDTEEQAPNIWNYDYSQIAIIIQSTKVSYLNEFAGFIYNVGDYPGYTGKVATDATFTNGKWYKCVKPNGVWYCYNNCHLEVNYICYSSSYWQGNDQRVKDSAQFLIYKNKNGYWAMATQARGNWIFIKGDAEKKARITAEKKRIEEEKKMEEERRKIEEEKRIAEEARIAEEKRIAEEARQKKIEEALRRVKEIEERKKRKAFNDSIASGFIQGHEVVDLGLSVGWATYCVGASKPKKNGVPKKPGLLLTEQEIKQFSWGGEWRLPTEKDYEELIANCTFTVKKGLLFPKFLIVTSKINGKSIIIPFVLDERPAYSSFWCTNGIISWHDKDTYLQEHSGMIYGYNYDIPLYKETAHYYSMPNPAYFLRYVISKKSY